MCGPACSLCLKAGIRAPNDYDLQQAVNDWLRAVDRFLAHMKETNGVEV